ncbi:hypothetical protein LTR85_002893 [Meristemomyces frigidus]|nr:hypothetical protein LTR85_002893 [Meristemomyces frigidus]
MPSPSEQVFEIPELLEMILCQVGPHGLSDAALLKRKERLDNARIISKHFQQAIESSIHLKRARSLAHANTLQLGPNGFPLINPLLERLMRKMGAEIWRYNYDSKKPEHLIIRIMRTWSYPNEDGYEELEHSDDYAWRQFKVTASKLDIEVTLKQGHDDRVAYANERSYDLSSEPGDFGATVRSTYSRLW